MKPFKIQSHAALRAEMVAVARGDRPAPKDAAVPTFESIDVLLGLLTPANRALLAVIRDKKPRSVAQLAELTGRAQPNLLRTLGKLEAVGFVQLKKVKNRRVPTTAIRSFRINVDPFSSNDGFEWA